MIRNKILKGLSLTGIGVYVSCLILPGCQTDADIQKNLFEGSLEICSEYPLTGFARDGFCRNITGDEGKHLVCAQVTLDFLEYSRENGNDLISPTDRFPGLKPGDRWCLCASRWAEAFEAGVAPPIDNAATHVEAQKWIPSAYLEKASHLEALPDL